MRAARERATLTTAVGILTMFLGALLALAPSAVAQDAQLPDGTVEIIGGGNVPVCHATHSENNPYILNSPSYSSTGVVTGVNHNGHEGPVFAPGMKAAGTSWGDIIPPISLDGTTVYFAGLNWPAGQAIWDNQCGSLPEDTTTLTVRKIVDGTSPTKPPTWSYVFTGLGGFTLTNAAASTDAEIIDSDTDYTITETNNEGATSTLISCLGATVAEPGPGPEHDIRVRVAEGGDAVCTFTNIYDAIPGCTVNCGPIIAPEPTVTPDPGSLRIVKSVDAAGDDPAPADWSFPFTITHLGEVDLTDADPDFQQGDLPSGAYTITETDAGDADLTDITCSDGSGAVSSIADDGSTGSVIVTIDEGVGVLCTFTNTFPEVLDAVEEPEQPTEEVEEPEETAVLGEQVVRTLPRTGRGDAPLAAVGLAMLMIGATLVGGARLRLRELS